MASRPGKAFSLEYVQKADGHPQHTEQRPTLFYFQSRPVYNYAPVKSAGSKRIGLDLGHGTSQFKQSPHALPEIRVTQGAQQLNQTGRFRTIQVDMRRQIGHPVEKIQGVKIKDHLRYKWSSSAVRRGG
jgi:hypothetical protein